MGELTGRELLTVLIMLAVLAAGRLLVHALRRQARPAAVPTPAAAEDGEATQEMPTLVDEVWLQFYATMPRRRRWPGLNRRPR